jgi:hypothetical protein
LVENIRVRSGLQPWLMDTIGRIAFGSVSNSLRLSDRAFKALS